MARTAAVVGTATATRNAVNRRQADKNAKAYTQAMNTANPQAAAPPQEYAPPPPAQVAQEDPITAERLGALKARAADRRVQRPEGKNTRPVGSPECL
jgi:hypothetical protein